MSSPGHEWVPHDRTIWSVCSRCGMVRNYGRETTTCSGALPKIRQRSEIEDCGQDGVCRLSPGCNRHWEERNRELVRERDEARAFLRRTAMTGGSIVSSAAMTATQIAIARAADRMLVTPDGYGFVYIPGPRFCACGRVESDCDQSRASCPKVDPASEGDDETARSLATGCARAPDSPAPRSSSTSACGCCSWPPATDHSTNPRFCAATNWRTAK